MDAESCGVSCNMGPILAYICLHIYNEVHRADESQFILQFNALTDIVELL